MSLNKADKFGAGQIQAAGLMKALAHPARVAILELLADRATCICGDVADELPLAQSTISQHLKVLKNSGLIKGEVDGTSVCYCLNELVVQEFDGIVSDLIQKLKISIDNNCCKNENKT